MQWKVEVDEQLGQIGDACDAEADRVSAAIGDLQKKMEELGESTAARMAAEAADMAAALAAAQQQLQAQIVADAMKAQVVADTHKSELEGELDAQERAASQVRAPRDMDYLPTRWS